MSEIKKTKRHSPSPHLQAKPDSSPTRDRVLEAAFSLTREGRFGFDTILLVELDGRSFRQVDLGTAIQRALDTATAKEAPKDHVENPGGPATAYVRFGEDGKIRFRSISTSNPKSLDNVPSYYALFQGTYDPGAARWTILLTLSPN